MTRNQLRANSSRIHDIINNFLKEINNFKTEVNGELADALTLVRNAEWEGDEAKKFRETMVRSANTIKATMAKTEPIEKKLEEKARQWAVLLAKLNQ